MLIPLIYLVALFGRIEQGRLAVSQAAAGGGPRRRRSADRRRRAGGRRAAARRRTGTDRARRSRLELGGSFERGGVLEAEVSGQIAIGQLPLLGDFGTITVQASARAPVDQYRSLAAAGR